MRRRASCHRLSHALLPPPRLVLVPVLLLLLLLLLLLPHLPHLPRLPRLPLGQGRDPTRGLHSRRLQLQLRRPWA